ncbi:MAG: cobalt-precorrin-5B (C(1))-methyltransferase CbiD [bacterium]|nr:cobalt-precorrin-5B (C(1))-methyltransferase CbiD [bacterium]
MEKDHNKAEDLDYVYVNNKKLRCGYTTGSCAAAAAKAASMMLLLEQYQYEDVKSVQLMTPKGIALSLGIYHIERDEGKVTCAVQKDSGDDADVTNGIFVYATVEKVSGKPEIELDGGIGVGRVTKPGLDQPIGNAAINSTPRKMIISEVEEIREESEYQNKLKVTICIPKGVELAEKTFNPRLGIVGGISVLGTSGIVEPMSEKALVDTIRVEINMLHKAGDEYIVVTPGNYGEQYLKGELKGIGDSHVKSSNFIGDTIDMGFEFKLKGMLFVGHIGKMVKLAAGIMNTHSKYADGRIEILINAALTAGASLELLKNLQDCVTTDEALHVLEDAGILTETMNIIMEKIEFHLKRRAYDGMEIGAIVFSNQFGLLGKTSTTDRLIKQLRTQQECRRRN